MTLTCGISAIYLCIILALLRWQCYLNVVTKIGPTGNFWVVDSQRTASVGQDPVTVYF